MVWWTERGGVIHTCVCVCVLPRGNWDLCQDPERGVGGIGDGRQGGRGGDTWHASIADRRRLHKSMGKPLEKTMGNPSRIHWQEREGTETEEERDTETE